MPRITCSQCQRPDDLCFCDSIRPVHNTINVKIIQHPNEADHPFNTGRIATLALSQCEMLTTEKLSEQQISSLTDGETILLYPDLSWMPSNPPLPNKINNVIVIDANWKKSKKMLHLNPQLQDLPRFSLNDVPTSDYRIRATSRPDGLATIEAIAYCLEELEKQSMDDLLIPFRTMVERQLAKAKTHSRD